MATTRKTHELKFKLERSVFAVIDRHAVELSWEFLYPKEVAACQCAATQKALVVGSSV